MSLSIVNFQTQMLHGAGISTYIYPTNHPNVGKYTIHGASGRGYLIFPFPFPLEVVKGNLLIHSVDIECGVNFQVIPDPQLLYRSLVIFPSGGPLGESLHPYEAAKQKPWITWIRGCRTCRYTNSPLCGAACAGLRSNELSMGSELELPVEFRSHMMVVAAVPVVVSLVFCQN